MATLTGHLDFFAPCIPTSVSAIFLVGGNLTNAWDMRALGLFLVCQSQFPPFQILVVFLFVAGGEYPASRRLLNSKIGPGSEAGLLDDSSTHLGLWGRT